MSWRSPVVWSQGMFLQPHHFQQEARSFARLVDERARCGSPHAWGYSELVVDDTHLARGAIGIARASGVLPDGTPFAIPQLDEPPAPLDITGDLKNELIYLALPFSREGVTEVDFGDAAAKGMSADALRVEAAQASVRDHTSASDEPASIQTARLKLRLIRAKDLTDAYAVLGIAHVAERRADSMVLVDRSYIPPMICLDATEALVGSARLLQGLVTQRAQGLAASMGQLGNGISEVSDFLMLLVLNRSAPLLRQHALTPNAHPHAFHADCLRLAGELATFTSASRVAAEFPPYRHDDLRGCFAPLIDALRRMLSVVPERNAVQIELVERNHGVRTAVVTDMELVRTGNFVLGVNAQMPPEQLRQRFVAQSKLSPPEHLRKLVNGALPGIGLRAMPVAPRQLPYHAGYFYFELERGGELWQVFERTGNLALHVGGDFPGLALELWAIRNQGV